MRCSMVSGYYNTDMDQSRDMNAKGIKITSLYDLAEMIKGSDKIITLSR
jgi:sulfur relay (sulfurtransferase) complex TusBCD TusD component (DsrE family)